MSLQDRFELGEILLDGPIRCYAARDVASGSNVLIHVGLGLRSDFLLNTALAHPLSKALLEQGQDGQTLYVVTERKEPAGAVEPSVGDPFLERRVWRTNPPPADARAAPPAPPQPDSGTRGMQAQFFETSAIRERTHIGKKPDAIGDASQIFAAPAKKAGLETPGEFTQMFSSPAAHTPEPPDDLWSRPTRILPAMPVEEAKTGEEADAADTGSVPAAQPGEFTRMFQVAPIAETHTDFGAPATMPQPIPDAKPVVEPGEFTRMFQAAPIAETHTDSGAPATMPQPLADAKPVVEPGEFTRMFQAPAPIAETHTDSGTPATTPQPIPDAKPVVEPGEFTRMFQAPAPDSTDKPAPAKPTPIKKVETAPAAQPERGVEHGEFTRMFQAPPASTPRADLGAGQATGAFETPGKPAMAREQEKETRLFHAPAPQQAAPGDFTAFFQRPAAPPSAPEPLPPPVPFGSQPVTLDKAPSSFTQFFQNPAAYGTPQAAPLQPQMQQAQPPTPGYAGPGGSVEATGVFRSQQGAMQRFPGEASEYTRMFEKPTAPAPFQPEPKAVQPAPAAPHKDNSKIILVVILSVLLLIAIGLVIFFALR